MNTPTQIENWLALQQPFLGVLHLFLLFCLGATILTFLSTTLRAYRHYWPAVVIFSLFAFVEGIHHIEHSLPFFILPQNEVFHRVVNLTLSVLYTLVFGAIIYAKFPVFEKKYRVSLIILGALIVSVLASSCFIFSAELTSSILVVYSGLLGIFGGLSLFIMSSLRHREFSKELRGIGLSWMCFSLIGFFAWADSCFVVPYGHYIHFPLQIISLLLLVALIVLLDLLFVALSNRNSIKYFLTKFVFLLQWATLGFLVLIAYKVNDLMIRNRSHEIVETLDRKVYSLGERILSIQEQNRVLASIMSQSDEVIELLRNKEIDADEVNQILDRFSVDLGGGICYIMNTEGTVVATTNRKTPLSLLSRNYSYREYFQKSLEGMHSVQYIMGATTKVPGMFSSSPVVDPSTGKVLGVAVIKKTLSLYFFDVSKDYSVVFDADGNSLISSGGFFNSMGLDDFEAISVAPNFFKHLYGDSRSIISYQGSYYLFEVAYRSQGALWLAVATPINQLLLFQAGLYVVSIVTLFFVALFFIFVRYIVVRAQRELEQANEFKTILDCTPNCISLVDRDFNTTKMQGQGVPFLGKLADEFVGHSFVDIWAADKKDLIQNALKRAFTGDRMSFEGRYYHPDDYTLYFFVVCGPVYDSTGRVKSVVAIWVDITHIKKVETELLGHLELEKTLSHITSEFIGNPDTKKAFDSSLDQILKLSDADRVSWFENEDAPDGRTQAKLVKTFAKPGMPGIVLPENPLRIGGDPRWLDWSVRMLENKPVEICLLDSENAADIEFARAQGAQSILIMPLLNAGRWLGFVRFDRCLTSAKWTPDKINKLRASIHQLQENIFRSKTQKTLHLLDAAVRSANEGILITNQPFSDVPPRIVFANPAMCRMSGYSESDLLQMDLKEFEGENYKHFAEITNLLSVNNSYKASYHRKNQFGDEYLVECSVYPIKNVSGKVTHYLYMHSDVTEEHELQSRASLSSKLESIGQLAAGIAHEINTPAQFISDNLYFIKENWNRLLGDIETLKEQVEQQRRRQIEFVIGEMPSAIGDALEGVERITTIVQAMREFSHSGGLKARANLNKAIETTVTVARNEWKYVADIDLQLDPDMPQLVCYIADINQVVLNLIVNSAHAIKEKIGDSPNKGTITIKTSHDDSYAYISITDTGAGIPESVREKIYDPFFTTKAVGEGTGQGLFLAHRVVVERHNGNILCDSEPGEGTTFTLKIPFQA